MVLFPNASLKYLLWPQLWVYSVFCVLLHSLTSVAKFQLGRSYLLSLKMYLLSNALVPFNPFLLWCSKLYVSSSCINIQQRAALVVLPNSHKLKPANEWSWCSVAYADSSHKQTSSGRTTCRQMFWSLTLCSSYTVSSVMKRIDVDLACIYPSLQAIVRLLIQRSLAGDSSAHTVLHTIQWCLLLLRLSISTIAYRLRSS